MLTLLPLLLVACTGTPEVSPGAKLVFLSEGGAALQALQFPASADGGGPLPAPTLQPSHSLGARDGLALFATPDKRHLVLMRAGAIEQRFADHKLHLNYETPPFSACWRSGEMQTGRLLAYSRCNDGSSHLAFFNEKGEMQWWARLGAAAVLQDEAPSRPLLLASGGALLVRPTLTASEILVVAPPTARGDQLATVKTTHNAPRINDAATLRGVAYAATNTGVYRLGEDGHLEAQPLPAFGNAARGRLWAIAEDFGAGQALVALSAERSRQPLDYWSERMTGGAVTIDVFAAGAVRSMGAAGGQLHVIRDANVLSYDGGLGALQNRWRAKSGPVPTDVIDMAELY